MHLLQPFTSEPKELVAAVERATSGDEARRLAVSPAPTLTVTPPPGGPGGGLPARPDLPGNVGAQVMTVASGVQSELEDLAEGVSELDTLYGLGALARGLGRVAGRKTVLFVAEDREIPERDSHVYDAVVDDANRANVTVHTVDARGLALTRPGDRSVFATALSGMSASASNAGPSVAGAVEWAPDRTDGPGGPLGARSAVHANPKQGSFLGHVAGDTGGLVIAGTNDLGAGLARVVEEIAQYYEVVYEPPRPEPDGRFRRITTKALRKGVRLRTRSGYFARPGSAPTLAAFELPLLAALGAPEPPADFPHAATVMHFAPAGAEREALFLADVALGSVRVVDDAVAGTYRARLAMLGFVRDAAGRAVARFSSDWPIEGPLHERARLSGTTALFKRGLTLPPGSYELVTAIQDREANRTSVARSRFDVPAPEAGLALGSLSVVRRASEEPSGGPDPLGVGGVSIAPYVGAGELPAGLAEVSLFLPIYTSSAASPVELELEVRGAGGTLARTTPPLPAAGPEGRIAWTGSLPAEGLVPGRYEVVATVRQAGTVAEERTAFVILDPGDGESDSR